MDKVEITAKEIEQLLEWRDCHKDLIYRNETAPLRTVEIIIRDTGYRIKAIRDGDELVLYLNAKGRPAGKAHFRLLYGGKWNVGKNGIKFDQKHLGDSSPSEVAQSMLTIYCSLMALMIYSSMDNDYMSVERIPRTTTPKNESKRITNSTKKVTYIIKSDNGVLCAIPQGSHRSPRGVFSVRGHFRHYRDGKVVWIAEYSKGKGKNKKSKTYRVGRK